MSYAKSWDTTNTSPGMKEALSSVKFLSIEGRRSQCKISFGCNADFIQVTLHLVSKIVCLLLIDLREHQLVAVVVDLIDCRNQVYVVEYHPTDCNCTAWKMDTLTNLKAVIEKISD